MARGRRFGQDAGMIPALIVAAVLVPVVFVVWLEWTDPE